MLLRRSNQPLTLRFTSDFLLHITPLREGVVMTRNFPTPMAMHSDQKSEEQGMQEKLLLCLIGSPRFGTIEETGIDGETPLGLNRIKRPLGHIMVTRFIKIPISIVPTMPLTPDVATIEIGILIKRVTMICPSGLLIRFSPSGVSPSIPVSSMVPNRGLPIRHNSSFSCIPCSSDF
jgi:hypothetical protein